MAVVLTGVTRYSFNGKPQASVECNCVHPTTTDACGLPLNY